MPEGNLSIRRSLLVKSLPWVPGLLIATVLVFGAVNKAMITLRGVQAGEMPVNDGTLEELASAAVESFEVKEKYEVLDILEDNQAFAFVDVVLENMTGDNQHTVDRGRILLRSARNAANAGWHDKAIRRFEEYLQRHSDDLAARGEFTGLLSEAGRKDEAISEYQLLTHRQPRELRWWLALANAALTESITNARPELRYLRVAQDALNQALALDDRCDMRKKLAHVQSWLGEHDRVLELLQPCEAFGLDQPETCRAFAEAVAQTTNASPNQLRHVSALGRQAVARANVNPKTLTSLARALRVKDECDLAVRLLEKALQSEPGARNTRFELANLLQDSKRFAEAEKHYAVLLGSLPSDSSEAQR